MSDNRFLEENHQKRRFTQGRFLLLHISLCLFSAISIAQTAEDVYEGIALFQEGDFTGAKEQLDYTIAGRSNIVDSVLVHAYYFRARAQIELYKTGATENANGAYNILESAWHDLTEARKLAKNENNILAIEEEVENLHYTILNKGMLLFNSSTPRLSGSKRNELLIEAIRILEIARSIENDYLTNDVLGQAQLRLGDSAKAYTTFQQAIALYDKRISEQPDPFVPYIYYRMALIERYFFSDYDKALSTIEQGLMACIDIEAQIDRMQYQQSEVYAKATTNLAFARKDLENLRLDLLMDNPEKLDEALQLFERELAQNPYDYDKLCAYATLLERNQDTLKAKKVLQSAIAVDSSRYLAWYNLGALTYSQGYQYIKKKGDENDQASADQQYQKGIVFIRASLPYFEKAFAINPHDHEILDAILQICNIIGDEEKYERYKAFKYR